MAPFGALLGLFAVGAAALAAATAASEVAAFAAAVDDECRRGEAGAESKCALSALQVRSSKVVSGDMREEDWDGAAVNESENVAVPEYLQEVPHANINMSALDTSDNSSRFKCGWAYCVSGSICCQSRNVNAALCCAAGTVCRFMEYDFSTGIRSMNVSGYGSPRCWACNYPRAKPGEPTGCEDATGGSLYYGAATTPTPAEATAEHAAAVNA